MTMPNDNPKNPGDRFRNILSSAGQKREDVPATQNSPLGKLPRLNKSATQPADAEISAPPPGPRAWRGGSGQRFLQALWTIASVVSLLFNIILVGGAVLALRVVGGMNIMGFGTGLVGGLYSNFEKMDAAHIKTTIPIQKDIPVSLNVCIKTGTNVVINQNTNIPNAKVTVQTGGLNIQNASTAIVLPANTNLPVNLDLCVPVNTSVTVAMNVNVDIPLASTDLHPAIQGLEDTIRPLYCIVDPSAKSISGSRICSSP